MNTSKFWAAYIVTLLSVSCGTFLSPSVVYLATTKSQDFDAFFAMIGALFFAGFVLSGYFMYKKTMRYLNPKVVGPKFIKISMVVAVVIPLAIGLYMRSLDN